MNVTMWSINLYVRAVSSVGEGIPFVKTKASRASQMHSRALTRTPRNVRGRRCCSSPSQLWGGGGNLKLQWGKGKPSFQRVHVSERAADNRAEVGGIRYTGTSWKLVVFITPTRLSGLKRLTFISLMSNVSHALF